MADFFPEDGPTVSRVLADDAETVNTCSLGHRSAPAGGIGVFFFFFITLEPRVQ